jgi:hypothetical protein
MLTLSICLYLREAGLKPYRVAFQRHQSAPVRSMLDEGVIYCHPARQEEAIVYAENEAGIPAVLDYHYLRGWSGLRVLP